MQEFLVIGGPPRSGTRFIANALNAHSDIVVQGEMHPEMLRNSLEYFRKNNRLYKEIDKKQKGQQVGSKYWKRNRRDLFYRMVCAGQKINVLGTPKGTKLSGFKLPRAELQASGIARVVGQYSFLYCLRRFEPHFLSCANRWNSQIDSVAEQYRESITTALELLQADKMNFVAFSLEKMEAEPQSHLMHIAGKLQIADPETWVQGVDPTKKANHAEKFVSDKRETLNDDEQAFMNANPDLDEMYDRFWSVYDAAQGS
ncbi:MAG: sulfotransferase [Pseudooceanicola atlanticus]